MCAEVLQSIEIVKVPGRTDIFTINMKHKILPGTNFDSLFSDGMAEMDAYVNSGFKTLPTKSIFRTDRNQASVDSLTVVEVEALLQPVMQHDGSLFIDETPEDTILVNENDPNSL
jgi:hypothetical protein